MKNAPGSVSPLGAQIWLEPDDSAARVDHLYAEAAESGLGVPGQTAIVSHVVAWELPEVERLLAWTEAGGTLVIDGTSGRKDFDATQHQPWPGHLGPRIDLVATGQTHTADPTGELALPAPDGVALLWNAPSLS